MNNTHPVSVPSRCIFDPIIEEEDPCVIRRIDLNCADDLYRLQKCSTSDMTRFSDAFTHRFGVFLFDIRQPNPTETFLADLGLWIKEHRHQYRCPVVLLPSGVAPATVSDLAKNAVVLFHRPNLDKDVMSFFEAMMFTDAVIRCDLWDIVTATNNKGCWELVSYTGDSTDADELEKASVQLLSSLRAHAVPPVWLLNFEAAPDVLKTNPLRPIFRRLAATQKDALMVCSVKAETTLNRGFRVTVLNKISLPNSATPSAVHP